MADKKIYRVGYAYPHMYLPATKIDALEKRLRDLAKETGDDIVIHQPCSPDDRKKHFHQVFIECSQNFADRVSALQFGAPFPSGSQTCLKVNEAEVMTAPKLPAKAPKGWKFGF